MDLFAPVGQVGYIMKVRLFRPGILNGGGGEGEEGNDMAWDKY